LSSSKPAHTASQRWRLDLAYDGRGFNGFAYQPRHETVVGLLRETLQTTLQLSEPPTIVGAGRTDTGVHALRQTISLDLPSPLFKSVREPEADRLIKSLNKQLRGRIKILEAKPVSDEFHARYSATWREYRYLVFEDARPNLNFASEWSWALPGPLNLRAMNRAGKAAIGTHDFRAFCRKKEGTSGEDPIVRKILTLKWERLPDTWEMTPESREVTKLTIRAQSFCHNMVRCLTSTMVEIGLGELPENTIAERLESLSRDFLPPPAPPQGLALVAVGYPNLPKPVRKS
jgi:tRNA pseudouridine38-40 synthase